MEYTNIITGIILVFSGIGMVFVGSYYSKKIGIIHVVIYFLASFVIFGGVAILLLYERPSIF